jgi:hypothetical protein
MSPRSAFKSRFNQNIRGDRYWITEEFLKEWDEADAEIEPDDEEADDLEDDED